MSKLVVGKTLLSAFISTITMALFVSTLVPSIGLAAQRQVDTSSCAPRVSLSVVSPSEATTWAFEESIGRLTPSNITGNGVWIEAEGVIRWGADLDPSTTTLSYDLSGSDGSYRVSGRESLDGRSTDVAEDQVQLTCDDQASPEVVKAPTFSQPSGTRVPVDVSIATETTGASIYYTLDGSVPTTDALIYSSALNLSQATYLKAIAVKDGMTTSEVFSAYFAGPQKIYTDILSQSFVGGICEPIVTIDITPVAAIELSLIHI